MKLSVEGEVFDGLVIECKCKRRYISNDNFTKVIELDKGDGFCAYIIETSFCPKCKK